MEKVKAKKAGLDREWVLLLEEARKIGLTPSEVREFLLKGSNKKP
ncbi:anti-repressor SinI family protein [Evansella sp. AB-P1]|nr:anti-repressor SinI family protein [Evansella sp. AB-P1]MDG5786031.1 anti-repressor SinI family protein [Evansella sp. AB-P1]